MKKIFILLFGIAILAVACDDDDKVVITDNPMTLCDSLDILYTNDVKPLLASAGCSGPYCHGSGAGGFSLDNFENTKISAENAKFLKAIRHETGASPMPKGQDKLSDGDIQIIECWIQSGMRE